MNKLSIKVRVTLYYSMLVLLICGMLIAVIAILSDKITENAIYELLADEVSEKIEQLNSNPGVTLESENIYISDGVYIQIYDKDGEMLAGALPSDFESMLTPIGDAVITTRETADGYMSHCEYSADGEYIVRGILSRKNMYILSRVVLRIASLAVVPLVIMAFFGGGLIAQWAFRPLRKINKTVEEVAGGDDLSKRVGMDASQGDEIGTLICNFDKMMERLERSFEREKEFTSDASHELRTPVSVILAQCQCALKESSNDTDIEAFETIQRHAKKMSTMISEMLAITRMERQMTDSEMLNIDVSELVMALCADMREIYPDVEIKEDIEANVFAEVNMELLNVAYENLLTNALRYGGGTVEVVLRYESDKAVFSVADNGRGIYEDEIGKIWNRFYRGRNAVSTGGVGLGLAFVKEVAVLHDGEVQVESTVGKGSKFSFIVNSRRNR